MVAIETRYYGPTDTRGSRIVATTESGHRVSVPYPHEYDGERAHRVAAVALCQRKLRGGDCGRLIGAGTKKGYVFVFAPASCRCGDDAFRGMRRGR